MIGKRLCVAGFLLLIAVAAAAQETTTGSIAGRVVDEQELVVPSATVTLTTPQGPLRSLGDAQQDRRTTASAAKGTWQVASAHRLGASFFGDPAVGKNGPQGYTAARRLLMASIIYLPFLCLLIVLLISRR